MDKNTKEALITRLNYIKVFICQDDLKEVDKEIDSLLKDVKDGIIVPF